VQRRPAPQGGKDNCKFGRNAARWELLSRIPRIYGVVTHHSNRIPGFGGAKFEHFARQSAICSDSNECMMAASQVKSILRFFYIIATAVRILAATT
jgi:hypothetical protein